MPSLHLTSAVGRPLLAVAVFVAIAGMPSVASLLLVHLHLQRLATASRLFGRVFRSRDSG